MQPTPTLSKQRVVFLRFLIDLQQANAIPGDIDDYYGHESRATRAVGDSRRFMTVVFHRKSKPQHIEAWLKRKDKLLNATDEEYTFLGFTENNIKNGHLLYFREGPDWTVETLKQHFGEGLWDVYRRGGYGKYSARLGLSFSSTVTSVEVLPAEVHTLDDLQADDSSLTSDGSGLIRDSFARELIALHNLPPDTSVFQIRHAGYKGTTTRVPDAYFDQQCGARGKKVAYRPSMLKYTGGPNMFEIQSISRPPRVARVNMQFIILLLTRGVPMRVLEEMLQMQIDEIGEIATNRERALHYIDGELDSEGSGIGFFQELYEMLLAGHDLDEPYLAVLLHRFQKSTYDGLRSKLNFIAPRSYYLLGVVDPYGVLQDGQVYMNLPMHGGPQVGALAFMRNPAYDADGLVVLEGVNVPQLSHIVNTVVFAAGGATSQTARMSGGDLDGDLYFCTANPLLIPAHRPPLPVNAPPAHTPRQRRGAIGTRQPQAEPTTSDSRNTAEDMFRDAVKTFLDHRHNFLLGMMSNDFMKRVVNTAELADSAECRALLPLILATLDALKNDGKISLLRLAFDDFKTNHPERIINGHRNPLHQLQDMVPNLGERRMDDFKVDMDLILEDSQGVGELWAEKLQEAVPIMNEYGGRLQMAIAADADAKALKLEDGGEKRTDRVKREFFEREFPALTRQNILVELPNRILKASVFYATGYGNGKQSFAWVGARYLNYLKATADVHLFRLVHNLDLFAPWHLHLLLQDRRRLPLLRPRRHPGPRLS
ncbi:RNA dependent RNA polymerase-domain-containing protein [Mycena amicta]|nr:RNA dependent RNA polymerase-domain-containing protein [Mycena amicta]